MKRVERWRPSHWDLSDGIIPSPDPGRPSPFDGVPFDVLLEVRNVGRYSANGTLVDLTLSHQIGSLLHPLDLLRLARTSHPIRSSLMSKASRVAWTKTFKSLYNFPACPPDMSEPFYAALVFDTHCFVSISFNLDV